MNVFTVGPQLSLSIVSASRVVVAGSNAVSTIAVQNASTFTASNISVTQTATAPNGMVIASVTTSSPGVDIAAGATQTFELMLPILSLLPDKTLLTITSSISSDTCAFGSSSVSTTFTVVVKTLADLVIAQKCGKKSKVDILVYNAGPSDARGVVVTVYIPEDATFVSTKQVYGPSARECKSIGDDEEEKKEKKKKKYFVPILPSGAEATFRLRLCGTNSVCVKSSVRSCTTDPNPDNNKTSCSV